MYFADCQVWILSGCDDKYDGDAISTAVTAKMVKLEQQQHNCWHALVSMIDKGLRQHIMALSSFFCRW